MTTAMPHLSAHAHAAPPRPAEAGIIVEPQFGGAVPARGKRLLFAHEVLAVGEPAFFDDFGEQLLFFAGQLLDLRAAERTASGVVLAPALPEYILREPVGLEYGWRHASGCGCRFCAPAQEGSERRARPAADAA